MMRNIPIDLLIFDLDGTTADTRQDLTHAVNHVLQQLDRPPLTLDTVVGYVGDGIHKLLVRALGDETLADWGRPLFNAYYAEHSCDNTRPYPGMAEVLAHFSDKKRAVLTNKAEPFALSLIQCMGLDDAFDLIVGARPGMKKKPAPDPVLYMLEQLNIPANRALLVGDSPQDIQAGQAAGVYTVAVTYGFRPETELRALQPDGVIDHPMELVPFVL